MHRHRLQDINNTKKMRLIVIDDLQESYEEWLHHDEGAMVVCALSFFDVKHLLLLERVNKTWRKLCKKAIQDKCGHQDGPKTFQSKQELRDAVLKYCKYDAVSMEEIACTYGYPIDRWNVSQVDDMSDVFFRMYTFNEPIGSWDVSRVRKMQFMFDGAGRFNQDIGTWNVSSVTNMGSMFYAAGRFNQDIGSWDVSNVTDMSFMFYRAYAFNQDIGRWDVSNVEKMSGMFCEASTFDHDI
jgi:surface protein